MALPLLWTACDQAPMALPPLGALVIRLDALTCVGGAALSFTVDGIRVGTAYLRPGDAYGPIAQPAGQHTLVISGEHGAWPPAVIRIRPAETTEYLRTCGPEAAP